jgi:hypothetical protein
VIRRSPLAVLAAVLALAAFVYLVGSTMHTEPITLVQTDAPTVPHAHHRHASAYRHASPARKAPKVAAQPPRASSAWVDQMASRTGIPAGAVQAYADAQLAEPSGCDLGWTTLAGIGWVESQNGTIGHRQLLESGLPSRPIIGPALDGASGYAALSATRLSTRLTGDASWEHAVGPLQFISSTWQKWGTDGDGDGHADPQDLNDAALTAARYLCASGGSLDSGSAWSSAVLSYNHDQNYVKQVFAAADYYGKASQG